MHRKPEVPPHPDLPPFAPDFGAWAAKVATEARHILTPEEAGPWEALLDLLRTAKAAYQPRGGVFWQARSEALALARQAKERAGTREWVCRYAAGAAFAVDQDRLWKWQDVPAVERVQPFLEGKLRTSSPDAYNAWAKEVDRLRKKTALSAQELHARHDVWDPDGRHYHRFFHKRYPAPPLTREAVVSHLAAWGPMQVYYSRRMRRLLDTYWVARKVYRVAQAIVEAVEALVCLELSPDGAGADARRHAEQVESWLHSAVTWLQDERDRVLRHRAGWGLWWRDFHDPGLATSPSESYCYPVGPDRPNLTRRAFAVAPESALGFPEIIWAYSGQEAARAYVACEPPITYGTVYGEGRERRALVRVGWVPVRLPPKGEQYPPSDYGDAFYAALAQVYHKRTRYVTSLGLPLEPWEKRWRQWVANPSNAEHERSYLYALSRDPDFLRSAGEIQ